jgi:hypothetical protein
MATPKPKKKKISTEKNREYQKNKVENSKSIKCKTCGEMFKQYRPFLKFCSRQCAYQEWKDKELRKNKNNPGYRNGMYVNSHIGRKSKTAEIHSAECRKFRTKFRKEHDFDFCEHCGTAISPRFETHHIIFASEAYKHKELHNHKNLIYLCIGCHNEFHKHKILRNKLVEERGLNELFGKNLKVYEKRNINQTFDGE